MNRVTQCLTHNFNCITNKKCHSMNHMNCLKYMDINSSYRDRNKYPNPCDFVIPYRGSKEYSDDYFFNDPVLSSTPYSAASSIIPPLITQNTTASQTDIVLDPRETGISNYYIFSYLEINNEYHKIIQYNGTTFTATVDIPFITPVIALTLNYTIRKTKPTLTTNITINNINYINCVDKIDLLTALPNNGSFNNLYFRFLNGNLENTYCKIVDYNNSTLVASIQPGINQNRFIGGGADIIEVSQNTEDNSKNIFYRTLGAPNVRYYELTLQYLTLPNLVVDGLRGGLLDNYPFVYVHIYNDGFQQSINVMYSNNLNSGQAIFKVPIDKNLYNRPTSFYTLKPTTQNQIIAFNPMQDLRFKITLPSGLTLKYKTPDTLSPFEPNPLVQISLLVSIKPVEKYDVNCC
jgi:hypothetical protein